MTGAAQGIGRTVAVNLAKEGGQVALVDRSEVVNETQDEIAAAGAESFTILADLEHTATVCRVMAEAKERFGRIDILINNVGGTIWAKPYAHYEEDRSWRRFAARCSRRCGAAGRCCRSCWSRNGGAIVNVSSIATRGVNRVPYAAAKGGVNAITASLALEYASTASACADCARRNRGAAPEVPRNLAARKSRAAGEGVARGGGADEGIQPDEALRHDRRAGRGDPVLRVR